jgi:sugar porter (SP) family MFS transporter
MTTRFGYNNGVAGGLLSFPSWIATFPDINTTTTTGAVKTYNAQVQGTVVAVYTLGCFFGSLNCIWLGDRLGRKRTIIFGAGGHVIGALLQSSSSSLAQLTVGRLVSGFFFGHLTATAPNWQAECSRAEHRGATVLLEGLFISMGLAISAWINLAMSYVTGSASWRFPLAFSALWAIIVILTMPFMPDSPRWLVKKGRVDEARSVMAALSDTEPDSSAVTDAIREIEVSLALAGEARFLDVFRNGDLRLFHRTCLAAAGQIFQQMSGVNVLGYYEASIFQNDLGLSANNSRIMVAAAFTWQTLCSPIGVLTVDRFGRRKLMIFSAIGMGCCMAIAAGCSSVPHNTAAVALAAAAIFMYSFFFPTGFLGLTFLYAAEVAPLSYRVPITSISTAAAWLFNFVGCPSSFEPLHCILLTSCSGRG